MLLLSKVDTLNPNISDNPMNAYRSQEVKIAIGELPGLLGIDKSVDIYPVVNYQAGEKDNNEMKDVLVMDALMAILEKADSFLDAKVPNTPLEYVHKFRYFLLLGVASLTLMAFVITKLQKRTKLKQ